MIKIINVTQEDIDLGRRYSTAYCPVALAVKRACPGNIDIEVFWTAICVGIDKQNKMIMKPIPEKVREFIPSYDSGHEVHPISFELDIPEC